MSVHQFEDLPVVMQKYEQQIATLATLAVQRAALAGGDYLARETPVDTGVARSNWVMTVDAPFTGVIPAYAPYPSYRPNHHASVKLFTVTKAPSVRRGLGGRGFPRSFGV